jgi:predicted DNA-binding transcriptional regulator YafY
MRIVNDPTARVLQLLSLLQTHKFWPGGELADRLDVSDRTLRRDVDRLRALGYPVDSTPGTAGGYRLAAGAHMPPLLLEDEEAVAIAVGLRAAAGASVEGIEETALRALAKLEQVLPDRLRRRVNAIHGSVTQLRWPGSGPMVDPAALAVLAQACRDHEEVRFDYQRRDGEGSRRLVQPHALVSGGRRWYLVAWDVRRSDWRTFRVDRLRAPKLAGARFEVRPVPAEDAAAFVRQSIGSMPMPHAATVVVDAPVEDVRALLRWVDATMEARPDGRTDVHVRSESPEWIDTVVALLAGSWDLEVTDPADLRLRLATLARRLRQASRPASQLRR